MPFGEAPVGDDALSVSQHGQERQRKASRRELVRLEGVDRDLAERNLERGQELVRTLAEVTVVRRDKDQIAHLQRTFGATCEEDVNYAPLERAFRVFC